MDTKNPRQGELARAVSIGPDAQPSITEAPRNSTVIDHQIVIGRGLGNQHMVSVEPRHLDHEPKLFDSHKKARGYAGGLRMCHRWQIVDQTGEAR